MKAIAKHRSWVTISCVLAAVCVAQPALADKVLRLRFDGPVMEKPDPGAEFSAIFGGTPPRTLRSWVTQIEKAREDASVKGIVMIVESPQMGLAQLDEITRAIRAFRDSGKPVHCYVDECGNLSYALASAASHVTLAEHSVVALTGLHAELSFYKGGLEKLGMKADMMHAGDYKTALEPFTRTEPSKENTEMINWLLDGLYERFVNIIAEGRTLSPDQVRAAIDAGPLTAGQAVQMKLVDAATSFDDFRQRVRKEHGQDVEVVKSFEKDDPFGLEEMNTNNPFAAFQQFMDVFRKAMSDDAEAAEPGIGLIYVEGPIVVGKAESGLFGGDRIAGSTTIRAALHQALEDESIKAVVLRVDSPGGSAVASDIMWRAATRLAKAKPLIVSMGNVAGSGGYYVSIPGDTIFAEATTLTGSIGVVLGKLVWRELWEDKLGVTTTEFNRGRNADIWSMNTEWAPEKREHMKTLMLDIYEQFKGRVTQSRGDRLKGELEQLAGGRVYTGQQALERGLVDKIGGLQDAIRFAAGKVSLEDDCPVYVIPKQKGLVEIVRAMMGEDEEDEFEVSSPSFRASSSLSHPLFEAIRPALERLSPGKLRMLQWDLQTLMLLDREHIGCTMPFNLYIH